MTSVIRGSLSSQVPTLARALAAGAGALLAALPAAAQEDQTSPPELHTEQVLVVGQNLGGRTTSVGKLDTPLMETPFSVSILTQDFFTATGVKTLQDALQYSAGVNGGTYGIDTRGDWSTIRGTAPVQYIDGLKALYGNYNNTRKAPYTLDRIEILKGPSSVIYGQGSLGGVINLTSKLPQEEFGAQVWAQYGTFERKQLAGDVTGRLNGSGEWLYRVVALARDSETQTDYVQDDSLVLSPSLTWRPGADTSVTLLANIQRDETGTATQFLPWQGTILPGAYGELDPGVFLSEPGWDKYESEQQSLTAIFQHTLSANWTLNARARYTDSSADYWSMWPVFTGSGQRLNPDGRTVARNAYISDATAEALVYDINTQIHFNTGPLSHSFVAGVDVQDATTDNNSGYGYGGVIDVYEPQYGFVPEVDVADNPATDYEQTGLYVQDQIRLGNFITSAALRHDEAKSTTEGQDISNYDTDATTGRLGLLYAFDFGLSPYASYTESFEPLSSSATGQVFEPKTGEQIEAGLKYQPVGSDLLFTAAAYRIDEKGRLVTGNDGVSQVQLGQLQIEGIELEAQASWDQIDMIASYSTTSEDKISGLHIAAVPEELFSIWTTYRFDQRLEGLRVGLGVRDIGQSWDGTENAAIKVPGHTLVDAMLGYEWDNWFFSLNARNLTDKIHYTSCLARGDCFAGERRTVTADVRYNF